MPLRLRSRVDSANDVPVRRLRGLSQIKAVCEFGSLSARGPSKSASRVALVDSSMVVPATDDVVGDTVGETSEPLGAGSYSRRRSLSFPANLDSIGSESALSFSTSASLESRAAGCDHIPPSLLPGYESDIIALRSNRTDGCLYFVCADSPFVSDSSWVASRLPTPRLFDVDAQRDSSSATDALPFTVRSPRSPRSMARSSPPRTPSRRFSLSHELDALGIASPDQPHVAAHGNVVPFSPGFYQTAHGRLSSLHSTGDFAPSLAMPAVPLQHVKLPVLASAPVSSAQTSSFGGATTASVSSLSSPVLDSLPLVLPWSGPLPQSTRARSRSDLLLRPSALSSVPCSGASGSVPASSSSSPSGALARLSAGIFRTSLRSPSAAMPRFAFAMRHSSSNWASGFSHPALASNRSLTPVSRSLRFQSRGDTVYEVPTLPDAYAKYASPLVRTGPKPLPQPDLPTLSPPSLPPSPLRSSGCAGTVESPLAPATACSTAVVLSTSVSISTCHTSQPRPTSAVEPASAMRSSLSVDPVVTAAELSCTMSPSTSFRAPDLPVPSQSINSVAAVSVTSPTVASRESETANLPKLMLATIPSDSASDSPLSSAVSRCGGSARSSVLSHRRRHLSVAIDAPSLRDVLGSHSQSGGPGHHEIQSPQISALSLSVAALSPPSSGSSFGANSSLTPFARTHAPSDLAGINLSY